MPASALAGGHDGQQRNDEMSGKGGSTTVDPTVGASSSPSSCAAASLMTASGKPVMSRGRKGISKFFAPVKSVRTVQTAGQTAAASAEKAGAGIQQGEAQISPSNRTVKRKRRIDFEDEGLDLKLALGGVTSDDGFHGEMQPEDVEMLRADGGGDGHQTPMRKMRSALSAKRQYRLVRQRSSDTYDAEQEVARLETHRAGMKQGKIAD